MFTFALLSVTDIDFCHEIQDIFNIDPQVKSMFIDNPSLVYPWLLGKTSDICGLDMMNEVWRISGHTINMMYKQVVRMRKGVG